MRIIDWSLKKIIELLNEFNNAIFRVSAVGNLSVDKNPGKF